MNKSIPTKQMIEKALKNIMMVHSNEWMTRLSVTRWVAIQRILAKFKAGKLTMRQVEYWANANIKPADGVVVV